MLRKLCTIALHRGARNMLGIMKFLRVVILGLCLIRCTCGHTGRYKLDQALEASRIGPGDKVNSEEDLENKDLEDLDKSFEVSRIEPGDKVNSEKEKSSEKDPEEPNGLYNPDGRCIT